MRQSTLTSAGLRVDYQTNDSMWAKLSHQSTSSTKFDGFQSSRVPRYDCRSMSANSLFFLLVTQAKALRSFLMPFLSVTPCCWQIWLILPSKYIHSLAGCHYLHGPSSLAWMLTIGSYVVPFVVVVLLLSP